jgi:hypothetical protein
MMANRQTIYSAYRSVLKLIPFPRQNGRKRVDCDPRLLRLPAAAGQRRLIFVSLGKAGMDASASMTVWRAAGGFSFSFALALYLRSTGLDVSPLPVIGRLPPEQVPVLGILFGLPIVIFTIWLADSYRSLHIKSKLCNRLPTIFAGREGCGVRVGVGAAFLLFPAAVQIHFLVRFFACGIYRRFGALAVPPGVLSHLCHYESPYVLFTDNFRFQNPHGETIFPFWRSWFYFLGVTVLVVYLAVYLVRLSRKKQCDDRNV